jgi:hypothetical protein
MRPLFATTYLFLIQSIWIYVSKVNILELEPRAFYWLTGTLFSNITVRFKENFKKKRFSYFKN